MSENRRRGARDAGRRALLKGLFGAALLPPIDPVLRPLAWPEAAFTLQAPLAEAASPFARFDPIAASDPDDVMLPDGLTCDVVLKWGDAFTASGRPFGYNNGTRTDAAAAPRGSNWPHRKIGAPPPPAVVAIRRKP